jgi:hypothetical protein
MTNYDDNTDDAADTLRMKRFDFDLDAPTDPDATSIYDLNGFDEVTTARHYVGHSRPSARRRQIRDTRENVLRLREAIAAGWDVAPELAFEERQLAVLEAVS